MRRSSGEKTADLTQFVWPTSDDWKRSAGAENSLHVLSSEADSSSEPEADQATLRTGAEWERRTTCFARTVGSHTRTLLSVLPLARDAPSGLKATDRTEPRWPASFTGRS